MKRYIIPSIALAAGLMTASCSDDDKATQPVAAISVAQTNIDVNTSLDVHFTGSADNVVVFPGDEGHVYDLRAESNSGLVVNKGHFTYSYSVPGTYKLVCVATNHSNEGSVLLSDTCSVTLRVIDDITEIERLSAPQVLYDEVFARRITDSDWLIALPRKIRFRTSNPAVALQQRLKFYIPSATTGIFIDGQPFDDKKRYDLSEIIEITTRSNEGSEKDYRLHTLNYGEFKTFALAGRSATVDRTEYDYSRYSIDIGLPSSTDITALAPEFTLFTDCDHVYVGSQEVISGVTLIDFSSPVTFRFETRAAYDPSIFIESTCIVSVSHE